MAGETTAKVVSVTATNQEVGWVPRYSTITVYNPSTTVFVYVTVDGSPAVAPSAAGTTTSLQVNPGQTQVFDSEMPFLDIASGQTVANLLGATWQAESGSTDSTNMTQVNIIGSAAGPTLVTIDVE